MQQKADRSAILGTMDMRRLVPKVSVPIMISMIVQALYNIVDSIFVSRFDPNGLTAVSLLPRQHDAARALIGEEPHRGRVGRGHLR